MDEIVVRLARAIACLARLQLLSLLVRQGELPPTRLAKELRLPLNVVSQHLRMLSSAGLLCRRKSGTWCYYRADSPYDATAISGRLVRWLGDLFKDGIKARLEHSGVHEVRNVAGTADGDLHQQIYEAATAFTDLRRVQLLRQLDRQKSVSAPDLITSLCLSPQALGRHMGKLMRRGYVRAERRGHMLVYALATTAQTPVHRRLFDLMKTAWAQPRFRTS
jgi:DNA-binding transcriptional ArsR family regulator